MLNTPKFLKYTLFQKGVIINRDDKGWKHLENFINENKIELSDDAFITLDELIEKNETLTYYTVYYISDGEYEHYHREYKIYFQIVGNNCDVEYEVGLCTTTELPYFNYENFDFEED